MTKILSLHPSLFVVVGIVTSALAQILLKRGSAFELLELKWIFWIVLSAISYFIAFLAYYLALKFYDISKISPVMMVSIVSLVAAYGFLTGESFRFVKLFGIILAIVSIFLISKS